MKKHKKNIPKIIKRLLGDRRLTKNEKELIKNFDNFYHKYNHLTYNQTRALYNIYHKYFININKSKKKNKSLFDYK